jgi:RNA polymerase sigma-70 factor (ECF subfamily)
MAAFRSPHLSIVPTKDVSTWTDRQLVEALAIGDPRAAVATWKKYAPRIFGVVQRAVGLADDAEDLTQDIFLRVFARVHTLKNPDAFGSFILSVALRVIKWQLRRRRVRRFLHLAHDGTLPDVPIAGLDEEARQALHRFYQILDTLPVDERTVFVLRHVEGMDLQEIARAVNRSLATIKRRLSRASARVNHRVLADPALAVYAKGIARHES